MLLMAHHHASIVLANTYIDSRSHRSTLHACAQAVSEGNSHSVAVELVCIMACTADMSLMQCMCMTQSNCHHQSACYMIPVPYTLAIAGQARQRGLGTGARVRERSILHQQAMFAAISSLQAPASCKHPCCCRSLPYRTLGHHCPARTRPHAQCLGTTGAGLVRVRPANWVWQCCRMRARAAEMRGTSAGTPYASRGCCPCRSMASSWGLMEPSPSCERWPSAQTKPQELKPHAGAEKHEVANCRRPRCVQGVLQHGLQLSTTLTLTQPLERQSCSAWTRWPGPGAYPGAAACGACSVKAIG